MAQLTLPEARRSWSARQQLGADVDLKTVPGGWSRALGGVDPYLAMRARVPGLARETFDQALAADEIWVVPGVRGCIWLVPAQDVPLALVVSESQARRRLLRDMEKLSYPEAQLRDLGERIVEALAEGAMKTDALRSALGAQIFSFGDAGKKIGQSTNLPPALRLLEWDGAIRRRHSTGRINCQDYIWEIPEVSPLSLGELPSDDQAQVDALAQRFFEWAAPATLEEFVGWSKVAKGKAKKAIAALGLPEHSLAGSTVYGDVVDSGDDGLHFIPSQDNLLSLRSSPSLLAGAEHHEMELIGMGKGMVPLAKARWMFHRVMTRQGRLVGFWEWDRDARDIVSFELEEVGADLADLAAFIRDDLDGEAKANSIDGAKSQRKRVDWVEAAR